jgi:aminoglycoside phosphotransferase family enzyme/predicted kinase
VELSRLIEALSEPSAYPHAVEKVEVHQTHISVVFLAGSLVYKIKKPVDMGFVDYSSLERRRHFCAEEVRLNRRLAPEVYLDVVPVSRAAGAIRINGAGEPIEWAVKMTRLPEDASLRARLRRGELDESTLVLLAARLAKFHAQADRSAQIATCASFDSVALNARENLAQAAPQVGLTLSAAVFDRLGRLVEQTLGALYSLIDDRAGRGMACDAHGDLRLEHVYWFPEREPPRDWVIVDCIEFAERYRHADPVADIAFLAMELSIRGQPQLARVFTNAYLAAARDKGGYALLPFYTAYRSMVRGKVRGLKSMDSQIPEAARGEARDLAKAHWLFALGELEEPARRPGLVLVAGLPGTGKSSLARELGNRAGFTLIRSDVVRKELAGRSDQAPSPSRPGEDIYTAEWNDRTYTECLRRAEELIFDGKRVLIDATFRDESWRRRFLDAARRCGVRGCLLLCQADPNVVRARLEARRGDASDADWAVHAKLATQWEEVGQETQAATRQVDTGRRLDDAARQALESLKDIGLMEG